MPKAKALAPAEYFVECKEVCGVYRITEATARRFLSKKLWNKAEKKKEEGFAFFILKFSPHCPMCSSNDEYEVELVARKYPESVLH